MFELDQSAPASGDFGALFTRVLSPEEYDDTILTCSSSGSWTIRRWHLIREDWLVAKGQTACAALRAWLEKREAFEARGNRRKQSLSPVRVLT